MVAIFKLFVLRAKTKYEYNCVNAITQVIKFTSYLPMFGGSLHVLRLLPPLKLVAMI
jgi:hypothetical protein